MSAPARIRSLLPLLILLYNPAEAQSSKAAVAKYAGEFIAIGVGGRALALGGAYAATANDVTAGYWNPAGLSAILYPQIALMHDERFGGLYNYDYAAAAMPAGAQASLGVSVIRLGVDNVPDTRDAWVDANHDGLVQANELDSTKIHYFNSADWAFYVTYAKQVDERLALGANVKLIRRGLDYISATGVGFDVGVRWLATERLALAANFQDVTTTLVAWNNGTNELISPTLKLGTAYGLDALDGRFTPAFDVDIRFEGRKNEANAHIGRISFDFHEGLEFDFRKIVALRAGYSDIGNLNVGTGIHLPKLDIDYAFAKFRTDNDLDPTHRISLTFTLEAEQFIRGGGSK